jgi:hypothetical protein
MPDLEAELTRRKMADCLCLIQAPFQALAPVKSKEVLCSCKLNFKEKATF